MVGIPRNILLVVGGKGIQFGMGRIALCLIGLKFMLEQTQKRRTRGKEMIECFDALAVTKKGAQAIYIPGDDGAAFCFGGGSTGDGGTTSGSLA